MNTTATEQRAWLMSMKVGKQSFQQGRIQDAVNAFHHATNLMPARIEGWVNFGSALLESGRFEDSVVALGQAIKLNPKLGAAHMLLGDAFRQLGEFPLALRSYREAVALHRTPLALNKLACALRVREQFEEARALYLEAIRIDPTFSLARVNLATLHVEMGHFNEARSQLNELATRALPPPEREEVNSSRRALSEYFRLSEAIAALAARGDPTPLLTALEEAPETALAVDETALNATRRYIESARQLQDTVSPIAGTPPQDWPLVEALFMIPVIDSVDGYLEIRAQLAAGLSPTGELLESLNMKDVVAAARASRDDLSDPVKAELHLRHWHALACRNLEGFLPGHFKYTQNWTTRNPTLKRVEPAKGCGTFRAFINDMYTAVEPGLPRAALVWMAVSDLHLFADGNGRVGLTWMNRELEWAGLMPALFSRELGLKGELSETMRKVRANGGDLAPLLSIITRAQGYARAFCAGLPENR